MVTQYLTANKLQEYAAVLDGQRDYQTVTDRAYAAALLLAHTFGERRFVRLAQRLRGYFSIDEHAAKDTAARMRQLRLAFLEGQHWRIKLVGELKETLDAWAASRRRSAPVEHSPKKPSEEFLRLVVELPHSRAKLIALRRPYQRAWVAAALLAYDTNGASFRSLRPKVEEMFGCSLATTQLICREMRELGLIVEQTPRLWQVTVPTDLAALVRKTAIKDKN